MKIRGDSYSTLSLTSPSTQSVSTSSSTQAALGSFTQKIRVCSENIKIYQDIQAASPFNTDIYQILRYDGTTPRTAFSTKLDKLADYHAASINVQIYINNVLYTITQPLSRSKCHIPSRSKYYIHYHPTRQSPACSADQHYNAGSQLINTSTFSTLVFTPRRAGLHTNSLVFSWTGGVSLQGFIWWGCSLRPSTRPSLCRDANR